ncbi:hypothetical protein BAZOLSSOX_311 [uncultured Gammaproteobacteria bacterium]|nr:hypothetical protein BAZOLSSOX_311 [uncultured Gammaproteobacteria bacterium]
MFIFPSFVIHHHTGGLEMPLLLLKLSLNIHHHTGGLEKQRHDPCPKL